VEAQRVGVDLEEREQMTDFLKIPASEPIPLSILELDLPAPTIGWAAGLAEKGVDIVTDDLGRLCVARADARRLFDEQREHEARVREALARNEAAAVAAYEQQRASIWAGLPADSLPVGVAPAAAMLQSAKDAEPKRQSPLEEAFSGKSMTYHAWPNEDGAA
jgi:hypothetical protein